MTANPKVAHYPEIMHITPVSSGLRRLLAPALLLALPVLMTACGGGKATRPAPPPPTANWPKTVPDNPEAANSVLMRAISLVGTPYRYGGNTPDSGFDCSGLVAYVYREMLDLKLPHLARPGGGTGPEDRPAAPGHRRPGVLRQPRQRHPCRHLCG